MSFKKLLCLAAVCCVFVAAGCAKTVPGGQPDGEMESNGGIAVRQGDYTYYINGAMPTLLAEALADGEQAAIFRIDGDGNRVRISTRKAYEFRIVGENIYFVAPVTAKTLGIYMVSINGGAEQKLLSLDNGGEYALGDTGVAAEQGQNVALYSFTTKKTTTIATTGDVMQIVASGERFLYYVFNKAGIMSTDCNGKEPVALTDRNGRIIKLSGSKLYYIKNDEKLVCVDISGEEDEQQLTNSNYVSVLLNDDNSEIAAYSDDKQMLYVMKLDGSTRVEIASITRYNNQTEHKNMVAYVAAGSKVFYSDNAEGCIYAVDYDGKNPKKLTDFTALAGPTGLAPNYYMDVVDDKLYVFNGSDNAAYAINLTSGEVLNLSTGKTA